VLLWQKRDHVLLEYFIGKISDDAERERSFERKRVISRFADSHGCRHRQICLHFGETPQWKSCGNCDNCGAKPRVAAQGDRACGPAEVAARKTSFPPTSPASFYTPMLHSEKPRVRDAAPAEADPALAEYLREWRRSMARENKCPRT